MATALLTGLFKPDDANDYGCTGRGYFDYKSKTIGTPYDHVDKYFMAWKHCVRCATENIGTVRTVRDHSL